MGQYKFMIQFVKGFGFHCQWDPGYDFTIRVLCFIVNFGRTDGASGYNIFNKWTK